MQLLAEAAVEESTRSFAIFDLFMIVFTIIIAIGVIRLARAENRNKFALGFATVSLLVFLLVDFLMVLSWFGVLENFQDAIFGK
ncbi:MAG: hypothetical protein WDZ91_01465 [Paenibacillaceae bacterium]